ncbi:30S ribosomal protein S6, partial [Durusdinium trenchii]
FGSADEGAGDLVEEGQSDGEECEDQDEEEEEEGDGEGLPEEEEEEEEGDEEKSGAEAEEGEATELEEEGEGEEEEEEEDDEEAESEEDEEEAEGKEEKTKGALAAAVQKTKRNSKTNKTEWDKFDRQIKSPQGGFPASLRPMLKGSKKTDLFNLWLDHGGEWDSVACAVERAQETVNLSRKEWVAIQAKTLKERLPEARFTELIRKRMEAGLFYKDDDFPEDELENWIYMPSGRMLRRDDKTSETLKATASRNLDQPLLDALTCDETGVLPAGALPGVKAASEAGQRAVLQALQGDDSKVEKLKQRRKEKEAEPVEPKTTLMKGQEKLQQVLDEATKA